MEYKYFILAGKRIYGVRREQGGMIYYDVLRESCGETKVVAKGGIEAGKLGHRLLSGEFDICPSLALKEYQKN